MTPGTTASGFLASGTGVYYKFPTQEDYTAYKLEGTVVSKLLEIPAASIDLDNFVKVTDGTKILVATREPLQLAAVSPIPVTVFFVPSSQTVSAYHPLGTGVEGARIKTTTLGDLNIYRYDVTGTPYDTRTGFNYGPSSREQSLRATNASISTCVKPAASTACCGRMRSPRHCLSPGSAPLTLPHPRSPSRIRGGGTGGSHSR